MKVARVKTPTIIQMEAVECGAACLAIVLSYHGKWVPLEQLRIDCGVSRDGSNALKIIQAAAKYGLTARGYKKEAEDLQELDFPAILFWEFNHFVVLEGFSKDRVFINDPGLGPRRLTYDELKRQFTGVALVFSKRPEFQEGGKPPSFLKDLLQRMKDTRDSLLYLCLAGFFLLIPGLALPIFLRIFVDDFLTPPPLPWVPQFLGALLLATVFAGTLTFLRQSVLKRLNVRLSLLFSSRFLWHLLRLPISFYTQRFAGEIAYRINFNDRVAQTLTGSLAPTVVNLFLTLAYLVCIFLYNSGIGVIALLALGLNLAFMRLIHRSRSDAYARLQQEYGKSVAFSIGAIQQIESIKAAGIESSVYSTLSGYLAKNGNAYQEIGKKDAYLTTLPIFFQALTLAGVMGYGGWEVIEGNLTLGMLMALFLLMQSFLQPVAQFVNFGQTIQNMKIDLGRLNDVLKNPEDPFYNKIKNLSVKKPKLEGMFEFRNVSFGYIPGDEPLIKDLSFHLFPGKRIALVGPSGSGKSTVAKLCCSLYPAWEGQVLYDGLPLKELAPELFDNSIFSVDQEIMMFETTIWENLTLWDPTITEDRVVEAAKDAAIHEEILKRHDLGYQAPVIEGGKNLSGGQKQRLEIARALLHNPTLLIMDEATSALDSELEKKISDNIRRRGCSCIMIAHRLSTIQDCDEIIVLAHGKVAERGTHQELKEREGLYQALVLSEKGEHP